MSVGVVETANSPSTCARSSYTAWTIGGLFAFVLCRRSSAMAGPAPLLSLTKLDGSKIHLHMARVIKITPSDPELARASSPKAKCGSTFTVETGTGAINIDVTEYVLNRGSAGVAGFLFLTDLQGTPIMINPAYVILARSHQPSGTVFEMHSSTGTEDIYVRDSPDTVGDWWAASAVARLVG
jgi:hypothetical protein